MPDVQICYRNLRRYKYQLMRKDYTIPIDIKPEEDIKMAFIELSTEGELTIRKRYAWDGPSGPTIDTKTFMRGSLVHDALYQLMREKHLDYKVHRKYADELLKKICLEDGMWGFRAKYVHFFVDKFGEKNAMPREEIPRTANSAQPTDPAAYLSFLNLSQR